MFESNISLQKSSSLYKNDDNVNQDIQKRMKEISNKMEQMKQKMEYSAKIEEDIKLKEGQYDLLKKYIEK
jgi:uncharacterized protein (DUF3084 family)